MSPIDQAVITMNAYGKEGRPFLFLLDFALEKPLVWNLNELSMQNVWCRFPGFGSMPSVSIGSEGSFLFDRKEKMMKSLGYSFEAYKDQFDRVMSDIKRGNSFLVNLTCQTPIRLEVTLKELYLRAHAKYKLRVQDDFACFSPETFVRIQDGVIASFPMKGTMDASLPNARDLLMGDVKEKAEHSTIVDLIRNDLSQVSTSVKVNRFRYLDTLETDRGRLFQVSSEITGILPSDYPSRIGELLVALLPAGSVTGAPKVRTVRIIRTVETYNRGFYTGVFGYFDGKNLDSAVMIRFFEQTPTGWVYKSGGGITALSCVETEYDEMLKKIYVPLC